MTLDDDFLEAYQMMMKQQMMSTLLHTAASPFITFENVRSYRRIEDISNTAFATSLREILSAGRMVRPINVSDRAMDRDVDKDKDRTGGYLYAPLAVC
jgi:hypothetical protein